MLMIATIFGANIGFEIMPQGMAKAMSPDAKWGLLVDLLFIRLMYVKL